MTQARHDLRILDRARLRAVDEEEPFRLVGLVELEPLAFDAQEVARSGAHLGLGLHRHRAM